MNASPDVTRLLLSWHEGDERAMDDLIPLVYEDLRRIARLQLRRERSGHTLGTTALVHEAFLNLVGQAPEFNDRQHFFAIASRVMRRVLVWYARRRSAAKRGGGAEHVPLAGEIPVPDEDLDMVLSLEHALGELEDVDPRLCRVVECRYFGGLTVPDTARALEISPATVKRDWQTARAWLRTRLDRDLS